MNTTPTSVNLFDDKTLAAFLKIPAKTPAQWRYLGRGPAFIRVGRHVRYRESDVTEWLASKTVSPKTTA